MLYCPEPTPDTRKPVEDISRQLNDLKCSLHNMDERINTMFGVFHAKIVGVRQVAACLRGKIAGLHQDFQSMSKKIDAMIAILQIVTWALPHF